MAIAISAARTVDAGAPQCGVTVTGLGAVAVTVTVETSWDGGASWQPVRGGVVSVIDSLYLRDYAVALNAPVVYRVSTGGVVQAVSAAVTVVSSDVWLQDPLAPRSAVSVPAYDSDVGLLLVSGSLSSITRRQVVDQVVVMGSRVPVASVGVRQAPSGVPLAIQGAAMAQADLLRALQALLDTAGQILVRGLPASVPLDPVAHVVVGDVTDAPTMDGLVGVLRTISMVVSQVRPQSLAVVVPWWTYEQVGALVASQVSPTATYAQVAAAMPAGKTYLAWAASPGVAS